MTEIVEQKIVSRLQKSFFLHFSLKVSKEKEHMEFVCLLYL